MRLHTRCRIRRQNLHHLLIGLVKDSNEAAGLTFVQFWIVFRLQNTGAADLPICLIAHYTMANGPQTYPSHHRRPVCRTLRIGLFPLYSKYPGG